MIKNKNFGILKGEEWLGEKFVQCRFEGLMEMCVFDECEFVECNFSEARLQNVGLLKCKLAESKLAYINFAETLIKSCDFIKAIMPGCVFENYEPGSKTQRKRLNLKGCRFDQTDLKKALFVKANLTEVSFKGANLEGVGFENCDLQRADFREALLSGINLVNTTVDGAKIDVAGCIALAQNQGFSL